MSRANRNTSRERKNADPKIYKPTANHNEGSRAPQGFRDRNVSNERRSDGEWRRIENDLYERQSL